MDAASLFALALSCTALSPPSYVAAVASLASEGNVYRVEVDGRFAAASNAHEALDLAGAAVAEGRHVRVGLGLLTPEELRLSDMDLGHGLSACSALAGLDAVLADMADNLNIADEDERWTTAAAIRAAGSAEDDAIADFSRQVEEIVSALPGEGDSTPRQGAALNVRAAQMPASDGPVQTGVNVAEGSARGTYFSPRAILGS